VTWSCSRTRVSNYAKYRRFSRRHLSHITAEKLTIHQQFSEGRVHADTSAADSVYIGSASMQRPPDPQLLGFLEAYDCHISDLALALREVILEEAPDASESIYQVYTVAIWFGFSGKMKDMFCYIATNAGHVNLGFPRGSMLPDPNRALEGDGKTMRHIKLRSQRDVERPFVRRYIQTAIEAARPGAAGTGKSVVKSERGAPSKHRAKKPCGK
jgi:hypothetical protein